jgi:hypothetical protein
MSSLICIYNSAVSSQNYFRMGQECAFSLHKYLEAKIEDQYEWFLVDDKLPFIDICM